MSTTQRDQFLATWDREATDTIELLRALPTTKYDFRPDPGGRTLGEMAWHLSEIDAYVTFGIEKGRMQFEPKPPNIERPRTVEALAPGYERVHADALARLKQLTDADFDRTMPFFDGSPMKVRDMLWHQLLGHLIHHRGQLALMCRLAGGVPPGLYGPNREATEAFMRASSS